MPAIHLLDATRLDRPDTLVRREPFAFLVAHGQLPEAARADLERDFPKYSGAGFFPYREAECGPSIRALVAAATAPAFASALGSRLGSARLADYPTLVTICRYLNRRHGTIHTDSRSKVATLLIYLNPTWEDTSAGCLRLLTRSDDIDTLAAPEVKPLYGECVAFRRADNSFHGHLPYAGERRVIQVAWLINAAARQRKTRRGTATRIMKKLLGGLDRHFGAGRDRNAAHHD